MTLKRRLYRCLVPNVPQPAQPVVLGELDRMPHAFYIRPILIYRNTESLQLFMPTEALVAGLAQTLEQFPIYYGQLARIDAYDSVGIQPSGHGVPVYETWLDRPMTAFDARWPCEALTSEFEITLPRATCGGPLLAVNVVRFADNSGVAVCTAMQHMVADIAGCALFLQYWSEVVRGVPPSPVLEDRSRLCGHATVSPPVQSPRLPDCVIRPRTAVLMHVSADQLAQLKQDVTATLPVAGTDSAVPWISTADALSALIVHAQLRADPALHDRSPSVIVPINLRGRFPHRLPANYFGNGVMSAVFNMPTADVLAESLGHTAARLRKAVTAMTEMTMQTRLDQQANKRSAWDDLEVYAARDQEANLCLTDWSKSGLYTVDYGVGYPERVRIIDEVTGPAARFLRGPNHSIEVYMGVPSETLACLLADPELQKYSQWIA